MSDTVPSGEPTSAPATPGAATPAAPATEAAPVGTFSQTRGSGLLRGKRPQPASASVSKAPVASGDYQPSSLEVIKPQSEYKNPFTGETSVPSPAPAPVEPVAVNVPAPIAASAPVETPASIQVSAPVAQPAPVREEKSAPTPTGDLFPFDPAEKAELKILPPADVKRPAVSWGESPAENASAERRDERPTFRPERREQKPFEQREPRQPRDPREQRDHRENRGPRENREPGREPNQPRNFEPRERQPREFPEPAVAKKSGGFLGWLKSLFGGKSAETEAPRRDEQRDGEHRQHRRRNRGGRGRGGYQGDNRGPRAEGGQPQGGQQSGGFQPREGGDSSQGGERRFEGGGRRRRRGGRGRNRDDRGPRPEGHQGGGAI